MINLVLFLSSHHLVMVLFLENLRKNIISIDFLAIFAEVIILLLQLIEEMTALIGSYMLLYFVVFELRIIHKSIFSSVLLIFNGRVIVLPPLNLISLDSGIKITHFLILTLGGFVFDFFFYLFGSRLMETLFELISEDIGD